MIIHLNDKTNSAKPLYYQSLVLLYLPCEHFSLADNENELFIDAFVDEGVNKVKVTLKVGDRESSVYGEEKEDSAKYAQMKNLIGRTFLKTAFNIFGFIPAWGISTGVKPLKLADMFLKDGDDKKAFDILTQDYMISPEKAKMAINACKKEKALMSGMGDNPCSLYISIPFCPTKCNYCSFVSCTTPRLLSLIPDYVTKLTRELYAVSEVIFECGLNVKSIYVGGGTPAILSSVQIQNLLQNVTKHFDISKCEFTFEAGRPDCITDEKLRVLSDFGVGRISINTQTTNDDILRSVGRNHTFSDYLSAMELSKKYSFKCVNCDLIAGFPGESVSSFEKSVLDVASLAPENITVHSFTLKRSSNYRMSGEKSFSTESVNAMEMTNFAKSHLESLGYSPYYVYRQKNTVGNLENVGYSQNGFESIYNIIMMGEYHTVFGVGAGSVTKLVLGKDKKVERIFSPKYPYEFLDENKYSGFDIEKVTRLLKER